jgi:hypothetical protein
MTRNKVIDYSRATVEAREDTARSKYNRKIGRQRELVETEKRIGRVKI